MMKKLELLKKIYAVLNRIQTWESLRFECSLIKINTRLRDYELIVYSLTVLDIPFSTYTSSETPEQEVPFRLYVESEKEPLHDAVIFFGEKVDLKIIYILAFILKEIYSNHLFFQVHYGITEKEREKKIFCGSRIANQNNSRYLYTCNTSKAITAEDILQMKESDLTWETFVTLFPNEHIIMESTIITDVELAHDDEDYDLDAAIEHESNRKYRGTYAQDIEGLDDNFIDDALDGHPDAYWNID